MKDMSIFIVHYSKLIDRKSYLDKIIIANKISVEWITEKDLDSIKSSPISDIKILGVTPKILGMDLGVNSRSLAFSRKKAKVQGYVLFLRSFISHKNNLLTTGSLPIRKSLPQPQLEVQRMHLTALKRGINKNSKWILILEDDAIPTKGAFDLVGQIAETIKPINTWIN